MNGLLIKFVSIWVLTGTIICFSGNNLAAGIRDELVFYWPLDEIVDGKTPDLVGTNHLSLHNISSTNFVPGKFGKAISLDGSSQFLSLIHSGQRNLPVYKMPEFTISMWVRGPERQYNRMLFAEGSTKETSPLFLLSTHREAKGGQLNVMVRDQGPILNNIPTDGIAFNNEWRHIVWVNTGNTGKVYINGEMDTEFRYERPNLSLNYLSIGALYRDPPTYFFLGELDEIAIWERPLTRKEVQELTKTGIGDLTFTTAGQ